MFDALYSFTTRHRRLLLSLAIVVSAIGGAMSLSLHSQLTSGWSDWDDSDSTNVVARHLIQDTTGINPQQGYILLVDVDDPLDPAVAPPPVVTAATDLLRGRPEVKQVMNYYSSGNPALVSEDGRSTVVIAQVGEVTENEAVPGLEDQLASNDQLAGRVVLGGVTTGNSQLADVVLFDLALAEFIVFPLLFLALIVVFRGVVAALLPLIGGAVTLLTTMLILRGLVEVHEISIFGLNLAFALGLGLSIDFSLLIVSRYRENLSAGTDPAVALRRTMSTAGHTVFYSALTVGSALVGLLVFPQRFLYSMGLAGIIVTAAALLFALVVLPAILSVLGHRVEKWSPKRWQRRFDRDGSGDPSAARWRRLATTVMKRPVVFAVVATVGLLLLASPLLGVKFTAVQAGNVLPTSVSTGFVEQQMEQRFAVPLADQEYVVVDAGPEASSDVSALAEQIKAVDGVVSVSPPVSIDDEHWFITTSLGGKPVSDLSRNAVEDISALSEEMPLRVTGPTADAMELNASLARHLPLAAIILVIATLVFLFIMTGSVVLPLKAVVMNALSLGAALGITTLVFQEGFLAGLFGTTGQGALDSTMPILLAVVAFGLSTDYGVFLLGRIKESHDQGMSNRDSVATGIEHTGRIVTSAALLMCLAMCAMLLSRVVFIKELGLGGALAVILDASIVRAILVPALMVMFGSLNWWAPRFMQMKKHKHQQIPAPSDSSGIPRVPASGCPGGGRPRDDH